MCSWCQVTEGFCFCGSSADPDGSTAACGVRTDSNNECPRCGHYAGPVPLDISQHGYDYAEFDQ